MYFKFIVLIVFINQVYLTKISKKQNHQPIYFKSEPARYYLIDSYLNNSSQIQSLTTIIIIDCQLETSNLLIKKNHFQIKWFKDDQDLEYNYFNINSRNQLNSDSNEEIRREILSNGSLKLTYKNEINLNKINIKNTSTAGFKEQQSQNGIHLISTFKCIASDSFGKIVSRASKVYRLIIDYDYVEQEIIKISNLSKNEASLNKFIRQPENSSLSIGKRLLLRCKPNLTNYIKTLNEKSLNLIQYEWFKDNKPFSFNTRTNLYKDGSLEITQVIEQDSGFYKCIAKFRSLVFESRQALVKINTSKSQLSQLANRIAPKFFLWPDDRNIPEDEEVIFECLGQNDANIFNENINLTNQTHPQLYKYKWLKDGVALDFKSSKNKQNKRYQLVQGFSLRIEKLQETDSGTYTCRICNQILNTDESEREECDERSGTLKVLVAPRFLKRPSNMNISLKSDAELECSAYGVPQPIIQWFKNGEPIYPSEYFQYNSNQGNLKILGIIAQDEGYYQCIASNELNTIQTVAQLIVQSEDYQQDYEEVEYNLNKPSNSKSKKATITPSNILKQKSSLIPQTSTAQIIHLSAPTNIKLLKAKQKSILLEWKPPSIVRTEDNQQLNLNSLSYMISWKAKDTDRQREMATTNTTILIDDLTPDTNYLIYISALYSSTKGPYSSIEVKTEKEANLPGIPIDFRAELVDSDSQIDSISSLTPTLKFKWKKPIINSENIVKYRLYYQHLCYGQFNKKNSSEIFNPLNIDSSLGQEDDQLAGDEEEEELVLSNEELEVDELNSSQEGYKINEKYIDIDLPIELDDSNNYYEFLLEDLLKYSTYKFRLVALDKYLLNNENLINLAHNSAEAIVETRSDVPDGAPENLKIETVNTTSILLEWSLPLIEKRNGLIIGYKIAVKENDKQVWHLNVDSEPRYRLISSLLAGHKYSFRISAKTVNGTGPASEWVIGETFLNEMDESKVPGQPVDLNTEPTDKSIVIYWLPPIDSKKILVRKYLLKYGIGFPDNEIEIPGNRNSFIINDLIPSSQYVISLKAANKAGYGMEILKDVVTKRKSALAEHENLYPPLNVQAVPISSQSIEVRWTDWHLKPEEQIPDDRIYTVRYNTADLSNAKYKFKNSTERNLIITELEPNTLYDFSVKLVINKRESDWSMTTSQMTMETSPAPTEINLVADPNSPNNVILKWKAPNIVQNLGYIISYIDEKSYKENQNNKWKNEVVNSINSDENEIMKHTIRKLNIETIYYFKIQAKLNRAFGAYSPIVAYKTPNSKGFGGGQVYERNKDSSVVLNKNEVISSFSKTGLDNNLIWIISFGVSSLFLIIVILVFVIICKKSGNKKRENKFKRDNLSSSKRALKSRPANQYDTHEENFEEEEESNFQKHNILQQQQQQLLQVNNLSSGTNKTELLVQSQAHLINCSNTSNSSTLMKQRTPHHQPLMINNPNHLMMNVMNPLSITNSTDLEFYSNMTNQQIFTGNSHANSDVMSVFNNPTNNNQQELQSYQYSNIRAGSINEENMSQTGDIELANSVIQAANAAFNGTFFNNNNNLASTSNINTNEPLFLRQTIRPKPIAIPISSTNNSNSLIESQSLFSTNNSTRKSFKNLPIATATLIPNNNINFNDANKNPQKLLYTARPYIIDNQVQSSGEYSSHSPASSSHSGGQSQLYDKIGNINQMSNSSTKSLLQPLKSFGANSTTSSIINNQQSSSISIPNTPAKFCDNLSSMSKSPAKKQLLVSMCSNNNKTSALSIENKFSTNKNEELTAEMANLEGIMKDLNAITAQQFEC